VLTPLGEEPRGAAAGHRVVAVDATRAPVILMLPPRFEPRFAAAAPDFRSVCSEVAVVDPPRPALDPATVRFLAEAPSLVPQEFREAIPRDDATLLAQANDVGLPPRVGAETLAAFLARARRSRDAQGAADAVAGLLATDERGALVEIARCLEAFAEGAGAAGDDEFALLGHQLAADALDKVTRLDGSAPPWTLYCASVVHGRVGDLLRGRGERAAALAAHERALDLRRALVARNPDEALWRRGLERSLRRKGDLLWAAGRVEEAAAAFRESLAHARAVAAALPRAGERLLDLVHDLLRLALLRLSQGDLPAARALGDDAAATADRLVALAATRAPYRHAFALTRLLRGALEDAEGRAAEAERWWRLAELELRMIAEEEPGNPAVAAALAACARRRGEAPTEGRAEVDRGAAKAREGG